MAVTKRTFRGTAQDTWAGLCSRYGVQESDLRRLNEIDPDSALEVGREMDIPSRYRIKDGDTLSQLAVAYQTTVDKLARVNHVANPNHIEVGSEIIVPAMDWGLAEVNEPPNVGPGDYTEYLVQPGDTLMGIGERFGVNWQRIAQINGIEPPYLIYANQTKLKIPKL
ncbi:MAG: LysM peptidoglycan-binding domain-containing protein [Chloroflexota bacterium]|nr:LysM peptidoglycan-binding domain-containing protein [Chloroflexota bacterium]